VFEEWALEPGVGVVKNYHGKGAKVFGGNAEFIVNLCIELDVLMV